MTDARKGKNGSGSDLGGDGGGTNGAKMSAGRTGIEIRAEMELGPKEKESQEQRENCKGRSFCRHVPNKKELMRERL